jgi:hypothetical protein
MYNTIRRIHLYTGLIVLVFLMMYFISGYVMIHRPWFGGQQSASVVTLNKLHRVHGYGGGFVRNAFVLCNDLASFACILFALSGVYLWWKTAQAKLWGILCLAISCAYGFGMIVYLALAR